MSARRRITHRVMGRADALCETLAEERGLRYEFFERWPTEATAVDLAALDGPAPLLHSKSQYGTVVVRGLGETIVRVEFEDGQARAHIWATSEQLAAEALGTLHATLARSSDVGDELRVTFWSLSPNGPMGVSRKVTAPAWDDIVENYTAETLAGLEGLRDTKFDPVAGGKLVLWHGDPGTGKTWALRALARFWREWLEVHYIVDPERFFGTEAAYLIQVLLGEGEPVEFDNDGNSHTPVRKWRLIVLEDTGELLTKDAKERSGQGLSRLLNVCDGMIGQGLKVLVLITTNEDLGTLHPAVTRPGRCAANVSFGDLSADEATAWLQGRGLENVPRRARSLAELFAQEATGSTPLRRVVGFGP